MRELHGMPVFGEAFVRITPACAGITIEVQAKNKKF